MRAHGRLAPTPRQLEMIALLGQGYQYKEIARQLGISTHSVGNWLHDGYLRLGVQSATQAVVRCIELGYLGSEDIPMPARQA